MKQHEVNERILAEMNNMKQEASKILFKTFLSKVEKICINNFEVLTKSRSIEQYFQTVKTQCYESELTTHLLEFLEVTAIDALLRKQISKVIESEKDRQRDTPLITTIINDIRMEKTHSESTMMTRTPSNAVSARNQQSSEN